MDERKVVFVTGSSRGIGLAIAIEFANPDTIIILNSRNPIEPTVLAKVSETGAIVTELTGDISASDDVMAMFETIKNQYGRLDVLVNNAGVNHDKLITRMKEPEFDDVISINLKGTFLMTQAAMKLMQKQRFGSIINISSIIGITGNIGQANYAASKAGIIGLTKSTAKEGALRNIRCNAVAPGMVETEMTEQLSEKITNQIAATIPLGRFGQPAEIAQAVKFLATNDYITGQVLTVDGGMIISGG